MSTCPKCHKELVPFEYGEIELLKCSICGGVWFQEGKFRATKQIGFSGLSADVPPSESHSESSVHPSAHSEKILCPDCAIALVPYMYAYSSDIQLHRCAQCHGIWANTEELLRIEELLIGYKESLDDAKAKVLPLMLNVKKQIQQEERVREEERKRKKKGVFNRIFRTKKPKNHKIQDTFEDSDDDEEVF